MVTIKFISNRSYSHTKWQHLYSGKASNNSNDITITIGPISFTILPLMQLKWKKQF